MKKKFSIGLFAAAALLMAGCGDESSTLSNGTGRIDLRLNLDAQVTQAQGESRADGDLTTDDLKLKMTSSDGSYSKTWNSVSEFAGETSFKVGHYTLEAYYGDSEVEDFESPYYYGSTEVSVTDGNTSTVSMTASLNNSMVAIEYSDAFKKYFTAYSAQLHTAGGSYIDYPADETRPVYVTPGNCDVIISLTKPNGQSATLQPSSFTAKAKTLHKVTFDVNEGAVGDATLVLSFDDTVLDGETVEIDLSDELMNAPAPMITPKGFTSGETLSLIEGDDITTDLRANIIARGGLSSVILTTSSKSLINQGWPAEVDLLAATDAERAAMQSLGFEQLGLWGTPDKMASINLTNVIKHIKYLESGDNTSAFALQVKDKYSKVCDELMTLSVEVKRLTLALDNVQEAHAGDTEVELDMTYNGNDLSKVKVQYLKTSGTYGDATYTVLTRGADETYRIKVTLPVGVTATTKLRAVSGTTVSEACDIPVVPFEIAYSENDVFAKYATITLTAAYEPSAKAAARATLYASTDGTNYSQKSFTTNSNDIVIAGLEPATKYYFKVQLDDRTCDPFSFTTEEIVQIPNGNLDANTTTVDSKSHWQNIKFEGWGTNNPMTTSQGGDFAYVRVSGTKQTTDAHSGNAACLTTHGWGSGNSAVGTMGGAMKYADAGLLHLGSDRTTRPSGYSGVSGSLLTSDLDCGIKFGSRPSSMTFYYKYSPKNASDTGEALVEVIDAAGKIISTAKVSLSKADAYTAKTLNLEYPAGSPKAAKIYVRFLSTNNPSAVTKNGDWITPPPFGGNFGKGEYKGSSLYVDDITLNY